MITQKEQLIKLILNSPFPKDVIQFSKRSAIECDIYCSDIESFADYLLQNGVILPVVRCKDCKYRNRAFTCMFHGDPFDDDDFCSKGVRRDEA